MNIIELWPLLCLPAGIAIGMGIVDILLGGQAIKGFFDTMEYYFDMFNELIKRVKQ